MPTMFSEEPEHDDPGNVTMRPCLQRTVSSTDSLEASPDTPPDKNGVEASHEFLLSPFSRQVPWNMKVEDEDDDTCAPKTVASSVAVVPKGKPPARANAMAKAKADASPIVAAPQQATSPPPKSDPPTATGDAEDAAQDPYAAWAAEFPGVKIPKCLPGGRKRPHNKQMQETWDKDMYKYLCHKQHLAIAKKPSASTKKRPVEEASMETTSGSAVGASEVKKSGKCKPPHKYNVFVKEALKDPDIQKLPLGERMAACAQMWKTAKQE